MAIRRFTAASTYDLTTFYNWLLANKTGTFLENMTITLTSASSTGSVLTIASENAVVTFNTKEATSSFNAVILTGAYNTWAFLFGSISYNRAGLKLSGAILCSKGILFSTYGMYSSGSWATNYSFGITVDSSGEIALIHTSGNINVNSVTGYKAAVYKSTAEQAVTLTPAYNSTLTSLAPITPTTGDNSITLPYAFAALHTQFSNQYLAAVAIDGNNYITNGCWYIKDGA